MFPRPNCRRLLGFIALLLLVPIRSNSAEIRLHADAASLAPDGVRVAYLQNDGPMVRIVVANLDEPSRVRYYNLGRDFTGPVSIIWNTSQAIELRAGSSTFARFTVDEELPPATAPGANSSDSPTTDSAIIEKLQRKLPHRSLTLINWDNQRRRVLFLAGKSATPGRYFIYDRKLDLLVEVCRRQPTPDTP